MKDQLTILCNFILFDEVRLNHMKSDVGVKATAKIFSECEWIINYKTTLYLEEIKNLYGKYLDNYSFFNLLEDENFTWATSTLALLKKVKTPYVFYLIEDRMFHKTTREEFTNVMDEVVKNNIGFMCIGKLYKYSLAQYPPRVKSMNITDVPYMDNDKHIYTYWSKDSPYGCLSNDSIYRKDVFEKSLERIIHTKETFPRVLEYGKNWLTTGMPDMLCAVPKNEIVIGDDYPGYELGK
tara:strand:+ start:1238 stop:1951 length:714 start_codon:yes stop_codon:yes gene_type:complete